MPFKTFHFMDYQREDFNLSFGEAAFPKAISF
jgi:hypothetical protein